jgi:CheY-like chemotaxis protein
VRLPQNTIPGSGRVVPYSPLPPTMLNYGQVVLLAYVLGIVWNVPWQSVMETVDLTIMRRVLLVDDNEKFLNLSRDFLESECEGVQVICTAASGHEALGLIAETRPDLLIIDLAMPDMSGLELTEEIRGLLPTVPIIILTLFDSPRHRQAAMEAGADAFVPKAEMDILLPPTIESLPADSP